MKIITIASDANFPGHQQLIRSLNHFNYDYDVMITPFEFGRQMKTIYQWCKANWGCFLYTDAYDTFALAGPDELQNLCVSRIYLPECQMMVSAEKACYPHPEMAARYPATKSDWKYVNGGGFISTCEYFCKLYEDGTHDTETNDQVWLAEQFLKRQDEIIIDNNCDIFQTIAFEGIADFSYQEKRMINRKTGSKPIFIHGNGHTDMSLIYAVGKW